MFLKGDKVLLTTSEYGDEKANPIWDGEYGCVEGTILKVNGGERMIRVQWDNGTRNTYNAIDLRFINSAMRKHIKLKPLTYKQIAKEQKDDTISASKCTKGYFAAVHKNHVYYLAYLMGYWYWVSLSDKKLGYVGGDAVVYKNIEIALKKNPGMEILQFNKETEMLKWVIGYYKKNKNV
tara:strand:- start:46451 stop:46987 length:537 start_codon:yes stop_codon:yes gene_type:complete